MNPPRDPARARGTSPARPAGGAPRDTTRQAAAIVSGIAAAVALLQHRHALDYGFSQDDFLGLARAMRLAPRLSGAWRLVSQQLSWDALVAIAGPEPRLAHAASIALWVLLSALAAWLLTRRLGSVAGLVGGLFLAAHPAPFTAVWWISAHGDTAASLLALASLAAWHRGGRARWAAAALYLVALGFKESVLLVPLVAAVVSRFAPGPRTPRAFHREPAWLVMAVVMLAWAVLARPSARLGGEAYALSPSALLPNLLTYSGWTLDAWLPTMREVSDLVSPWEFGWGVAWLALLALGCALPALRNRGGVVAATGWLAMTAPVLAVAHHTYHYYMVAALPHAAWIVGALADAVLPRGRAGVGIAAALALGIAVNGFALTRRIERAPDPYSIRADATLDRALVAANALRDVRAANLPPHARLRFWSPGLQTAYRDRTGDPVGESYEEMNVRVALLDGLAVRVLLPGVDSARFTRAFDGADTTWSWCIYRADGSLGVMGTQRLARLLAHPPVTAGAAPPASPR